MEPLSETGRLGVYAIDQGASWADLTSASFKAVDVAGDIAAAQVLRSLTIVNTHGSLELYVGFGLGAARAVTYAITVGPGAAFAVPAAALRSLAGANHTAICVQGSGANTTGRLLAVWAPA